MTDDAPPPPTVPVAPCKAQLLVAPPAPAPRTPSAEQEALSEELWAKGVVEYTAGWRQQQRGAGLESLRGALKEDARHAQRHYFVGCITSIFAQDREEAARCYERAIAADPLYAYAYQELCQLYESAGLFDSAMEVAQRAVEAGARWTDAWQHPPAWTPGLTARPWWDAKDFPWASQLEAAWESIRDEALQLRGASGGDPMPHAWPAVGDAESAVHDADIIAPGGEWRELLLFGASADRMETARQCPVTALLLEELVPGAVAMAQMGVGEIIFSALAPGTRLTPHCASSNVRLTCHLGLVCPEGARLKVGPTWGEWEEGKCIFFDDSYIHEVSNDSDSVRIVLLIRFWHPELAMEQWLPTLQQGMAEFQGLQQLRLVPPRNALADTRLEEAGLRPLSMEAAETGSGAQ